VARIYEFPKDALRLMDLTAQEEMALRNEKRNKWKDARRDVDVIAAYEIVPKIPFTFYPVRIVITTFGEFPNEATRVWQRFEEDTMNKKIPQRITTIFLKYKKLFRRYRENDDSESGGYTGDAAMSHMEEDGSFSANAYTSKRGFIFENRNEKKKYNFRIIVSPKISRPPLGLIELKPIKNGEKYYAKWHYSTDEFGFGSTPELELLEKIDFNHIFSSLKELTINHIEQTGIVEKFYAKRANEKKKPPQVAKAIIESDTIKKLVGAIISSAKRSELKTTLGDIGTLQKKYKKLDVNFAEDKKSELHFGMGKCIFTGSILFHYCVLSENEILVRSLRIRGLFEDVYDYNSDEARLRPAGEARDKSRLADPVKTGHAILDAKLSSPNMRKIFFPEVSVNRTHELEEKYPLPPKESLLSIP
jgi:hypothetical protein